MRSFLAIILFSVLTVQAAEIGSRAEYIGGTVDRFKPGAEGGLSTTNARALIFSARHVSIGVPYDKINLLEYGQNVSRRLLLAVVVSPMFLLSKSRKHFLTVGFQDENGDQQAMVLRVEKAQVRVVLASLEARTGVKVTYQDDEARKAGKG